MTTRNFLDLGTPALINDALNARGITTPTPIQAATLPDALAGRDVLGRGQTGSGKTYGFLVPTVARIIEAPRKRIGRRPRALILAPTRELATQIGESLEPLAHATGLKYAVIFGGVGQKPQVDKLEGGVDIVIACPGRLLDLIDQGHCVLDSIEVTVLDEADHMSDMGFLPMVRRILDHTPTNSQRMLFSATLDQAVDKVVKQYLHDAVIHSADPPVAAVATMEHHVLRVSKDDRFDVLRDLAAAPGRNIMFTRTKYGARNLARKLTKSGVPAVEMHGNLSQGARVRNLEAFHEGTVRTLVCTDIAARGIHVDDVGLVVHADPPVEHKAYLHRSGRTARAGESGVVITIELPDQKKDVHDLMRAAKITPTVHESINAHSAILRELAPGEREFGSMPESIAAPAAGRAPGARSGRGKSGSKARGGNGSSKQSGSGARDGEQRRGNSRDPKRSEDRAQESGQQRGGVQRGNGQRSGGQQSAGSPSDRQGRRSGQRSTQSRGGGQRSGQSRGNQQSAGERRPQGTRTRTRGTGR